jgi:hypothetical protein
MIFLTLKAAFLNSGTLFPGQTALQAVFLDSLLSFGHSQTPSPAIVLLALISSLNSAQAVCAAGRRSCARTAPAKNAEKSLIFVLLVKFFKR